MLSLALSLAVISSSGGLLADYHTTNVRLLDAPVTEVGAPLIAQYSNRPPPRGYPQPYAQPQPTMSLENLKAEYARLEAERPSLTGPIVMLSIAGGLLITSSILWAVAGSAYDGGTILALALIGTATFVGAVVFAIIGGVTLGVALGKRHRIDRDLRGIDAQIRSLEGGAPLPSGPMPPPPPPPQSQGYNAPLPTLAIAGF
jgi:hypothetical protein